MNYLKNMQKIKAAFSLLFFMTCISSFAQQPLSSSALDQVRKNNLSNKVHEYDGVKIKYEVVINSVKVSAEDSTGVVQDIMTIPGAVDCVYDPRSYSLIIKSDKGNKYLTIAGIQNILVSHNVHIMSYQEILYKN